MYWEVLGPLALKQISKQVCTVDSNAKPRAKNTS